MTTRKLIGYCGVDSGQIMLSDPCYVKDFIDDEDFEPTTGDIHPFSYNGACGATLNNGDKLGGQLTNGYDAPVDVVVTSGYGDGVYPVYAEYNGEGRLISATIMFDDDDEV